MIIVGDIASPTPSSSEDLEKVFTDFDSIFSNNLTICNFEGVICDEFSLETNTPVLFNHSSVIDALKVGNVKVAALANNHTLDLPGSFDSTIRLLRDNGISTCGAGKSKAAAMEPVVFVDRGKEVVLLNGCWDFLLYHQQNPSEGVHVNEIDNVRLIDDVSKIRETRPGARIVIYLHWSLDLEILPYPLYRRLAMALVDAGANLVIGAHSHCVQGGEKYKDAYIVYGLGNFFLPYSTFANGKLAFPDFSRLELAFEWDPVSLNGTCHWFAYKNEDRHSLELLESAPFEESERLRQCSPFDRSNDSYLNYFRRHRRKRFLIPIFKDPYAVWRNALLTRLLKSRANIARSLAKLKLLKWQS